MQQCRRGSERAVGYTVISAEEVAIQDKGKGIKKDGLAIAIPTGTYIRIAPRSWLDIKRFVDGVAGVVDVHYRGELGVVLLNHADDEFHLRQGDGITQLILEKITTPKREKVHTLDNTSKY